MGQRLLSTRLSHGVTIRHAVCCPHALDGAFSDCYFSAKTLETGSPRSAAITEMMSRPGYRSLCKKQVIQMGKAFQSPVAVLLVEFPIHEISQLIQAGGNHRPCVSSFRLTQKGNEWAGVNNYAGTTSPNPSIYLEFVARSGGPPLMDPHKCFTRSYPVMGPPPRFDLNRFSNASRTTSDLERRSLRASFSSCAASFSETLQVIVGMAEGITVFRQTQYLPGLRQCPKTPAAAAARPGRSAPGD